MSQNSPPVATTRPYLGQAIERVEDAALLAGQGCYGDDAPTKPSTLHAAILRSPHAHARLISMDIERALQAQGVRTVLTGQDLQDWAKPFLVGVKQPMAHWALAIDTVRYVGEPVAVVVAENRYLAEDALELIDVAYEVLTPITSIEQAIAPETATLLHAEIGTNTVNDRSFRYGEPEQAFAEAAHVVATTIHYPRNSCSPIECGVVIAEHQPQQQGYEVTSNFMGPFSLHTVMAHALKVPGNRLRLKNPRDSGGSFGVKQSVFPYIVLMCLAARKAKAPVKWVEDRLEHQSAATSASARLATVRAAVDPQGKITALDFDQFDDVGAYVRAPEPATFYRMHGCLTGPYDIAHLSVRNRVVLTNKTPTGLVRGFGGPQVYFALERLVAKIAQQLQLDPLDVYRRNFVAPDAFPFRAAAGALLDSGNYPQVLQMALDAADINQLRQKQAAARAEGRLYGIGFAAIIEPSISNMGYITTVLTPEQRLKAGPKNGGVTSATVSIDLMGGLSVVIASTPAGQGHMTVCAQVVADVFGVGIDDVVTNVELDTQKDAWSAAAGNYSSRFAGAVAGTVHLAATKLRDKVARIAAKHFAVAAADIVFKDGLVYPLGQEARALTLSRASGSAHWAVALLPDTDEPGLRETVFWSPPTLAAPNDDDQINTSATYGFVFDVCAVDIDPHSGQVHIDRYVTAHDAGKILNPALADGQIRGAFAQGLGAALMEEFQYGTDGSFQSATLVDYLMPTACEVPDPIIVHLETPSPFTPLGAKGLAEGNNMSTPVCIANAVADALSLLHPNQDLDLRLPLTPLKLMTLIGMDEPAPKNAVARAEPAPQEDAPTTGQGKQLRAQGNVMIHASPEVVFAILLNPEALAKVIPGCHSLNTIGKHHYQADVVIGVGLIKARYAAEIQLQHLNPPHSLHLNGVGKSSLGDASGRGEVTLEAVTGGTRLNYTYTAEVGGKIASVGGRMLEGAAKVVLNKLFEQLGKQAAGRPQATGWWHKLLQRLGVKK